MAKLLLGKEVNEKLNARITARCTRYLRVGPGRESHPGHRSLRRAARRSQL